MSNPAAPKLRQRVGNYLVISPCRNEARFMRHTLDSVVAQTYRPQRWIIVDDGSTDDTPQILAEYSSVYDWITVAEKPNRGFRAVGPGVVEAFYFGLDKINLHDFAFICKLDLDLALPTAYFETLLSKMGRDPCLGSCSGKPYVRRSNGRLVPEKCGDDMSVGMTKFYRTQCFLDIGGFVREVMWDAIDCHKSRQLGWKACSWDEAGLRFEHLRPMGSSQGSILEGRARHGFGQYYMGSDPLYFIATALYRMAYRPYLIGGLAMIVGFSRAWLKKRPQHGDAGLRRFVRSYQRRVLTVGKHRACAEIEARHEKDRREAGRVPHVAAGSPLR